MATRVPRWGRWAAALLLGLGLGAGVSAGRSVAFNRTYDPVPFSRPPERQEWWLGFAAGADRYLIDLNAGDLDCEEADALEREYFWDAYPPRQLPEYPAAVLLPYSRATSLHGAPLSNPRTWMVVDLRGQSRRVSFPFVAGVITDANDGCYYLASRSFAREGRRVVPIEMWADNNLIFALAGRSGRTVQVRRPLTGMPEHEDPATLPRGYQTLIHTAPLVAVMGEQADAFLRQPLLITGHALDAHLGGGLQRLHLVYWHWQGGSEQIPSSKQVWAVYRTGPQGLRPLLVAPLRDVGSCGSEWDFVPEFLAALDLDADGHDEVVLRASCSEGISYVVFAVRGDALELIGGSSYWGL